MSRYIGKRVSYECGFCKKQFTLNKQSIDDSEKSGEVFCSKQCSEQFYLSDVSCSIKYSESEEMIQIINQDGKVVFSGNYWDFDRSLEGFKRLFESLGLKVSMDYTYRYE